MFSSKWNWWAAFAIALLLPANGWAQVAEMKRGQLTGPGNTAFGNVVFSPDGKLLAAGAYQSSTISVFDIASMKEQVRLQLPNKNHEYTLAFSKDCRTLISSGREDGMIRAWDVVTGKQTKEYKKPKPGFKAFSPGGNLVALSERGFGDSLAVYDVATDKMVWQLKRNDLLKMGLMDFNVAAFSPDGKVIVSHGSNGEIYVWDAKTGALVRDIRKNNHGGGGAYKFVTFSPDSKHIATGGHTDEFLHVWDVETGKERLRIKTKTQYGCCNAATFSPDGNWMAIAMDGFYLYDPHNGKEVLKLEGNGGFFSPDGSILAVPGQNQNQEAVITLYDLPKSRQDHLPKKLTSDELLALWKDLATDNDFRLQRVFASFRAASADSSPFLAKLITPVSEADLKRVKGLIVDLDDDDPKVREKATEILQETAAVFEPLLAEVSRTLEPGEVRNRVRLVLRRQREAEVPYALLLQLRGLIVLEQIGDRAILEKLAKGAAGARITEEAKQSLDRLGKAK